MKDLTLYVEFNELLRNKLIDIPQMIDMLGIEPEAIQNMIDFKEVMKIEDFKAIEEFYNFEFFSIDRN
jgi:hypothetical protein